MKKVVDKARQIWYINLAVAKTTTWTLITEQWITLKDSMRIIQQLQSVDANFFEISKNL